MKSSAIRGLVIFAAGAATAALASGMYPPPPITVDEFHERATVLIAEVEALGAYVAFAKNGRVAIYTNVGACLPPNPPRPNLPEPSVDPGTLRDAVGALIAINEGHILKEPAPVYEAGKCQPYNGK